MNLIRRGLAKLIKFSFDAVCSMLDIFEIVSENLLITIALVALAPVTIYLIVANRYERRCRIRDGATVGFVANNSTKPRYYRWG